MQMITQCPRNMTSKLPFNIFLSCMKLPLIALQKI